MPYRGDSRIAELLMDRGRIAADQAQRSGQIWGGLAQNLGQIGSSALSTMLQYKQDAPKRELQQLQLQQAKQQVAGQSALSGMMSMQGREQQGPTQSGEPLPPQNFMKQEGGATLWDTGKVEQYLGRIPGLDVPSLMKHVHEMNDAHLEEAQRSQAYQTSQVNALARTAGGTRATIASLVKAGLPLDQAVGSTLDLIRPLLIGNGRKPEQVDQILQGLKANPEHADAYLQQIESQSSEKPTIIPEGGTAVTAGGNVVTRGTPKPPTKAVFAADAVDPTKTPEERAAAKSALDAYDAPSAEVVRHNKEIERISGLTAGRQEAAQQETARHNRAIEAQGEAAPALSPEGLDAAATMFAKTGQLPPMGMGKAGSAVRTQIINRAAALMPGLDIASNKADFKANQESLAAMQKQRDSIGAFEQTAQKNIDVFLKAAGNVVDTGSPLANNIARAVTGKMLGSPDQAAYDAARQVAINEIAKITSNPTLSGTLSDSARKEVEAFNPQSATLKQTVAVMRLLKQDMQNRTTALDEQLTAIKGRIGGGKGNGGGEGSDPLGLFGGKK